MRGQNQHTKSFLNSVQSFLTYKDNTNFSTESIKVSNESVTSKSKTNLADVSITLIKCTTPRCG